MKIKRKNWFQQLFCKHDYQWFQKPSNQIGAREFFRKTNEICQDNDCHVCPICEHCSDGIFISADDAEGLVAIVEGYQNGR